MDFCKNGDSAPPAEKPAEKQELETNLSQLQSNNMSPAAASNSLPNFEDIKAEQRQKQAMRAYQKAIEYDSMHKPLECVYQMYCDGEPHNMSVIKFKGAQYVVGTNNGLYEFGGNAKPVGKFDAELNAIILDGEDKPHQVSRPASPSV